MRHEYIVQVDDTDRSYDFAFVGQIRGTCKQLVLCKDCKHYKDGECTNTFWGMCESGYCSEGERKEE